MKPRYPLEVLSRIRAHETTLRARDKADLAGERRRAERKLAEAAQEKEAERSKLRAASTVESTRLGSGRAKAADLVRAERFKHHVERRIEEHERVEARAKCAVADAGANERRAAAALAAAHAAEKAVVEHRARYRANERRSLDKREDDTAEDVEPARRTRRGQRGR